MNSEKCENVEKQDPLGKFQRVLEGKGRPESILRLAASAGTNLRDDPLRGRKSGLRVGSTIKLVFNSRKDVRIAER